MKVGIYNRQAVFYELVGLCVAKTEYIAVKRIRRCVTGRILEGAV